MKRFFGVFVVTALILSMFYVATASSISKGELSIAPTEEECYVYKFTPQNDPEKWVEEITSVGLMYETVDISVNELSKMSTKTLLRAILDYPFIANLMFYNSPQVGYDNLREVFSGLREFESRMDAASVLLEYYSEFDYAEKYGSRDFLEHFWLEIMLSQEIILENISADKLISVMSNNLEKQRILGVNASAVGMEFLIENVNSSIAKSSSSSSTTYSLNPDTYSLNSIVVNPTLIGYTTTSTPSGTVVTGKQYHELEAFEIASLNNEAISKYPSATYRSTATSKYNCHAYAWNGESTYQHIWIDDFSEVYKFRSDTKYVNLGVSNANFTIGNIYNSSTIASWPVGSKLFFSSADHSAVRVSTSTVMSKWGFGPLMEHTELSPYTIGSITFYKLR